LDERSGVARAAAAAHDLQLLYGDYRRRKDAMIKHARVVGLFGVLALAGCKDLPPPLASDLPQGGDAATAAFDQRVKARFPVGSDEGTLWAELVRERFVIRASEESPPTLIATQVQPQLYCRVDWTIYWHEDGVKIADIGAKYSQTCL
jgi:hypothetical protein